MSALVVILDFVNHRVIPVTGNPEGEKLLAELEAKQQKLEEEGKIAWTSSTVPIRFVGGA